MNCVLLLLVRSSLFAPLDLCFKIATVISPKCKMGGSNVAAPELNCQLIQTDEMTIHPSECKKHGKQTFNEIQLLLTKTNGKLVSEVMTPAPLVVRETTNLEDAARLLLETKYRRLPVVDAAGNLVGIITRGNVVRAALHIKRAAEKTTEC